MQRKHQVFICSTFLDLRSQRQDLFVELYRNGFIPVGMEGFTPGDQGQLAYIRDRINECDYFIVIVANRYGSPSPASITGESITEFEYDYALSKGTIPISRFVIDPHAPWPSDSVFRSTGPEYEKLVAFKERIAKGKDDIYDTNRWYKDTLVNKVMTAVNAMRRDKPRPGLIRPTDVSDDAEHFGIQRLLAGLRAVDKQAVMVGHRQLWIVMNDGYNFFEFNSAYILKALENGTSVRILLVHPESPCIDAIADKSFKTREKDHQKKDIIKTAKYLLNTFGHFVNFKLLGHKQFNTYAAIINENECLIDFYFNFRLEDRRQDDRIAIRCSNGSHAESLYKKVSDDYETFWRETEARHDSDLFKFIATQSTDNATT